MAHPQVRYGVEDDPDLIVVELGRIPLNELGDGFIGSIETAGPAGLSSLRKALIRYAEDTAPAQFGLDPTTGTRVMLPTRPEPSERAVVELIDAPAEKIEERYTYEFLPERVALALVGEDLTVRVVFTVEGEDEPDIAPWKALLEPLFRRHRASYRLHEANAQGRLDYQGRVSVTSPDFWEIVLYLTFPTYGKTVEAAFDFGREVLALLDAADGGRLSPETARTLIEAGRADVLLGQVESTWLECKRQPYSDSERGRFELAKDVSSFANTSHGGLIVLGLQTRSRRGQDEIVRVRPIANAVRLASRYRSWTAQSIFPSPELTLRTTDYGHGRSILTISIPPQAPALRPFLVRGLLLAGDKVIGSHVAVFTRRGDETVETSAEELHSLIVAGRAALGYEPQRN